ncbi:histidine kinase [Actinomadura hibisca]|uniref:histidine kinase n=1 Tax=Actinomadura hibisca TaxID=68565 RepID=UPI0008333B0C|nr:histidine kinase [Actinomadura hibisca]
MDLAPYVDHLRRELAVAAAAGGQEAQELAERLTAPLESAARLVLLEALSAAADEVTRDLAPGSVEVRLRGRDPVFAVASPPAVPTPQEVGPPPSAQAARPAAPEPEDGGTARISLRVPEHLKPRIEEAASGAGLSVNAWLVRAVTSALEPGQGGPRPPAPPRGDGPRSARHYTGWVR